MRVERVFTVAGSSPYDGIGFRTGISEIRNPDGSVVFRLDEIEVPSAWSQVAVDVLAQKYFRKAGVPAALVAVDEPDVPAWLRRRRVDAAALERLPEAERHGGETSAKQVFDRLAGTWTYWGWKGGYFDSEARCAELLRRAALHARLPARGAELAAMVQHRPELGLRHRRPGPGPLLRRRPDRRGPALRVRLRATAAARLLHPEHPGRPGQSGRDHGSLGARGAPVQIRLGHRHQLLEPARRERAAVRRRQVVRADELSQDRRPGGRCDQVRRHHPARGQDGRGRCRPSGHPGLRPLEGDRGAEGRSTGRGLEAARPAHERDPGRLPRRRAGWRGPLQRQGQPRAQEGDPERARGLPAGERAPAGGPVRPPGLHPDRAPDLYHRLGLGRLSDGRRPELEQLGPGHRRVPGAGARGPRVAALSADRRQSREIAARARALGSDRARRLGQRRSRHPVRHHDQRMAHLPGLGPDQRVQPVLGVHVPRRHGVQSGLAQPGRVLKGRRRLRYRGLRPCRPLMDDRARDLGHDGPVPVREDRRAVLPLPHAGSGLCQPRRPADGLRDRLRQPQGPRARRRLDRADDRHRLCGLRRDGGPARAVRGLCAQPRADAPRGPQPPPRRPWREARLRGPLGPAGRPRCRAGADPRAGRGRAQGLGPGARSRPGPRLSQRPDHGDRADRHDRPGHGLRHDRDRARLRAGQVQEAGGRRLLQDHQPDGAQGAGQARLSARADRRGRALRGRPRHADRRARDQPRDARRQGLHGRGPGAAGAGAALRLRHQVRLQPLHAGRGLLPRGARHHRAAAGRSPVRPLDRARLLARPVRGRQPLLLRGDDRRGRAAPEGRAPAGLRLRQPLRPSRQALSSRPRATSR